MIQIAVCDYYGQYYAAEADNRYIYLQQAKLPSYYVGETFVRLIPFKNHINIESQAIIQHKEELISYKIIPKGMLHIYVNQKIPNEILIQIFAETLER